MLFVNDIILIDKTRDVLSDKLEQWRHTLESRDFRLSKLKTEYLKCWFNGVEGGGGKVTMDGVAILKAKKFKYLGLIIDKRGGIDEDIKHRIRLG